MILYVEKHKFQSIITLIQLCYLIDVQGFNLGRDKRKQQKWHNHYKNKRYLKMQEQASRVLLEKAREKFDSGDYSTSEEIFVQLNETDRSIQLNRLLLELQQGTAQNNQHILKNMLDMLTAINIELYEKNRPKTIHFIAHEMLYYNIVMLANQIGKATLAQIISSEGLFFFKSLQTKTSLSLIYQNLKRLLMQNRPSSSLELIQKFQKITDHCRNLGKHEQRYKLMINGLFIKTLLRLKMINEGQALFMLKFGEGDAEKFGFEERPSRFKRKFPIKYDDFIQFLHAQIEFFNANYEKSIKILSPYLITTQSNRERVYAQNNLGISLCMAGKSASGQKILVGNSETLFKIASSPKKMNPQVLELFQRSRQNILLAHLQSRTQPGINTHYNVDGDMKCYNQMKNMDEVMSYRLEYRKGQACLNLYHGLLDKSHRKLPWEDIHDNYDNVYYHPNVPYFQFKGRNKNTYLANKKPVYRRYILNEWNDNPNEQQADKDVNRRKFEKQAHSLKLKQLLLNAEKSFQKALIILQAEEAKVIKIEGAEKDMNKPINQKLYHEYSRFRSSILCLLAYTSLCQCKWSHVIRYAEEFEEKRCYEFCSDDAYNVDMYKIEALCEQDKIEAAYEVVHKWMRTKLNKNANIDARDGSNLYNCNMERGMNQQTNFLYNIAILHSRDNRIPETHLAIQNIFENLKMASNYSRVNVPLSMAELLIHYNMRIQNNSAALQVIKHRRILSMGANKSILNITK